MFAFALDVILCDVVGDWTINIETAATPISAVHTVVGLGGLKQGGVPLLYLHLGTVHYGS